MRFYLFLKQFNIGEVLLFNFIVIIYILKKMDWKALLFYLGAFCGGIYVGKTLYCECTCATQNQEENGENK